MFNYIKNDYKAKSFIFLKSAYRGSEKKKIIILPWSQITNYMMLI